MANTRAAPKPPPTGKSIGPATGKQKAASLTATSRAARSARSERTRTPQKDSPIFVARFGAALLNVPDEATLTDADVIQSAISTALNDDPRVELLAEPEVSTVENARIRDYFDLEAAEAVGNLSADDVAHTHQILRFNSMVKFVVRVPKKNQPLYRGLDDVPSETYRVGWNGVVMVVQWLQHSRAATASGGHVVFDILAEAIAKTGHRLIVQACSMDCAHRFMHVDVITFPSDPPPHFHAAGRVGPAQAVHAPWSTSVGESGALDRLFYRVAYAVEGYSELINMRLAIDFLHAAAEDTSTELLLKHYERMARRRIWSRQGLAERWRSRSARSDVRLLIARLWVLISVVESMSRDWIDRWIQVRSRWADSGIQVMFDETALHGDSVRSLDLTTIRSSAVDSAARLDSRVLVIATASSALAALAGAAIGRIGA